MTAKNDVVYILKNGNWKTPPEELRLSLRSLCNFPVRKVWFIGGWPGGFMPDGVIKHQQEGKTRYERVMDSLRHACCCPEISREFWLFNDDFFVLRKLEDPRNYDRGDLAEHVRALYRRYGHMSGYAKVLQETKNSLQEAGKGTKDYTVHLPMLLDKEAALEALESVPGPVSFRCWYGNMVGLESETIQDVKISDVAQYPGEEWDYCSTSDRAFISGNVGRYLRDKFKTPSRWEEVTG